MCTQECQQENALELKHLFSIGRQFIPLCSTIRSPPPLFPIVVTFAACISVISEIQREEHAKDYFESEVKSVYFSTEMCLSCAVLKDWQYRRRTSERLDLTEGCWRDGHC